MMNISRSTMERMQKFDGEPPPSPHFWGGDTKKPWKKGRSLCHDQQGI